TYRGLVHPEVSGDLTSRHARVDQRPVNGAVVLQSNPPLMSSVSSSSAYRQRLLTADWLMLSRPAVSSCEKPRRPWTSTTSQYSTGSRESTQSRSARRSREYIPA